MNWYIEVVQKKYAVFDGRARRKEYWIFTLVNMIIYFIIGLFEGYVGIFSETDFSVFGTLYALVVFIPALAVTVRRLHDTNRSGWWVFINLVPFIGWLVLLILLVQDSQPGDNQYGPNPKLESAQI